MYIIFVWMIVGLGCWPLRLLWPRAYLLCLVSQICFFFFLGNWSCKRLDWMDATAVNKIFSNFLFEIVSVRRSSDFQNAHPAHSTERHASNDWKHIWWLLHQLPSVCVIKHTHTRTIATSELRWTEPGTKGPGAVPIQRGNALIGVTIHRCECVERGSESPGRAHLLRLGSPSRPQAHGQSTLEMTDLCSAICAAEIRLYKYMDQWKLNISPPY